MTIKKIHPAWWMLLGCCAMSFVGLGIVNSCAGIFLTPVAQELGVGQGAISLYMTVQGLANILAALLVGKVLPKCKLSVLTTAAGLAICGAFGLMSQYHSVYSWYISGAVIGLAMPFCGVPIGPIIISNWFKKKEGLAMGIMMAFSGIAGVVLNPLIGRIISNTSWRQAYLVTGMVGAVIILPFTLFVLKLHPSDLGILPYGAEDLQVNTGRGNMERIQFTVKDVQKSGKFYALVSAVLFMACYNGAVQHMSGYIVDLGFSYENAGTVLSGLMLTMSLGKILMGYAIDRFGIMTAVSAAAAAGICGMIAVIAGMSLSVLIGGAAVFGLAAALVTVLPAVATKRVFGTHAYAAVYPLVTVGSGIGANFSAPLMGYIYDITQSYRIGFSLLVVMMFVATVIYWKILRYKK